MSEQPLEGRHAPYRFSVRCDRERNAAIERAAKAAGLSATTFVQQHFDTILDAGIASNNGAPSIGGQILTAGQRRLHAVLIARSDADGLVVFKPVSIAAELGSTPNSVRQQIKALNKAGLTEAVSLATRHRPGVATVYRVREIAE